MTYLTTVMMICSEVINLLFTLIPFIVFIVYFKEAKMFLTPEGFKSFIICQKSNVWVKMKHHVNFSALATFRTTPSPPCLHCVPKGS